MNSEKWRSEALRKKGNEIFAQVRDVHYAPFMLRLKLVKAHKLYEEALMAAGKDKSERASSYKNLAAVNWFWGKSEWKIYIQESQGSNGALEAIRAAKDRIPKSLEFYILALELGESGAKPEAWLTQVQETIVNNFFAWVGEQLDTYSVCFQPILINLCAHMDSAHSSQVKKELASVFYMNHVTFIFNEGFKYIINEDGGEERDVAEVDYKRCLNAIKECYLPLNKAESIVYSTDDDDLIKEFQDLKEKVLLHEYIFESIQARCQGDALLERALFDDEAVSREVMWDAIDWYRHSVSLIKEKDPENDAIALSRIGEVYSSVLKSEKLAYPYHLESTKIAQEIMCPRIEDSDWYKYSLSKVHQHEIEQEENEIATRVEETINVIRKEGEKSSESFLKFIYKEHKHPDPRNRDPMGNIDTPDHLKVALRKAIRAYHPDTNGRFHQHWRILCEEITKILNCKYKAFK